MRSRILIAASSWFLLGLCLGPGCPGVSQPPASDNSGGTNNNTGGQQGDTGVTQSARTVLPSTLTLDIDEFPEDGSSPTARSINPELGTGRYCALGHTVLYRFHFLLDRGLALAAKLNHDLEGSGDDPHLAGTFIVLDHQVAYKADFSAFDIDGDGTADGSGQPGEIPAALRLWVDPEGDGTFVRFLCALITTRPSSENAGAGELYLQPGVLASEAQADVHAHIKWDRTDPAHKWNEGFTNGALREDYQVSGGHLRVDVDALADSSTQKTLRSTTTFTDNRFGVTEFNYAARTLVGTGFALASARSTGGSLLQFGSVCLRLTDCAFVLATEDCDAIDRGDLDFLPAATSADTDWPADFPEEPTF